LKVVTEEAVRMSDGKLFHAVGPATQNAMSPRRRLVRGTTRSPRVAERRAVRVETVVIGTHKFSNPGTAFARHLYKLSPLLVLQPAQRRKYMFTLVSLIFSLRKFSFLFTVSLCHLTTWVFTLTSESSTLLFLPSLTFSVVYNLVLLLVLY